MVGMLISLLAGASLLLLTESGAIATTSLPPLLPLLFLTLALCISAVLLEGVGFLTLQRAELKATPRVIELYGRTHRGRLLALYIVVFGALLSYFAPPEWQIAIWMLLSGIAVDLVHGTIKRIFAHLSPGEVLHSYGSAMRRCIQKNEPKELCGWIEASTGAALQAVKAKRLAFCLQLLDEWQIGMKSFFEISKSISNRTVEVQKGVEADLYVFLFFLQRMETLNEACTAERLEPINSSIITTLGKITIEAAKYDISMAQYSLHYFGRIVRTSLKGGMIESAAKANCTLFAVAKEIIEEVDLSYLAIADFFCTLVRQLEENGRAYLSSGEQRDLAIITQPFLDLRSLFQKDRLSLHRDAPATVKAIDEALSRFQTLKEMLATPLPPAMTMEAQPLDDGGLGSRIVDELEEKLGQPRNQ